MNNDDHLLHIIHTIVDNKIKQHEYRVGIISSIVGTLLILIYTFVLLTFLTIK